MLIKKIFDYKYEKVGYRYITMQLKRKHGVIANHKRVRRSMLLQGLVCKIRRKKTNHGNSYKSDESRAFPNLLHQYFKSNETNKVYSGDVTEIRISDSSKIYMHMVKDLANKEIVSHNVSRHPDSELVTKDFKLHLGKLSKQKLVV
jgi:putative transposase